METPPSVTVGHMIRRGDEGPDEDSFDVCSCPECGEHLSWVCAEDEDGWNFGPDDGIFTCPICGAGIEIDRDGCTETGFYYTAIPVERP